MNPMTIAQAHAAASAFVRTRPMMHYPSLFFTPEHKRAAHAVYAFFRTADNLVDEGHVTLEQFRAWRAQSRLPAAQQSDPFLIAWADVRSQYNIDRAYEDAVLDGLELDLACHRYETLDELKRYCYGVAAVPFLLAMSIVGFRPGVTFEQAKSYIENMGMALQLTDIIRDVEDDLAMGRIYLPRTELATFGLTYADIEARRYDDRFKQCMRHFASIARDYYKAGWPIFNLFQGSFRLASGFGIILNRALLDEMEARRFDIFAAPFKLPVWKMFWLLATKWPAIYWPKLADKFFK